MDLDLLGAYGLELAIAPHWNNSEGGTAFDTRYCFIGKRRLKEMESLLPAVGRHPRHRRKYGLPV